MNFFDASILDFLQRFGQTSLPFNHFLLFISNNDLGKGIVTMMLFWWAWFQQPEEEKGRENRLSLVATLGGAFLSLLLGRVLQVVLPFRERPMNSHGYHFTTPLGTLPKMEEWSSFPSDHAALFYSLATGLFLVNRRAGILAFLYYFVAVCFPRMFLGLHYPTDILAGILMGVACTLACNALFRRLICEPAVRLGERYPGLFYSLLFFLTFELATLFDSLREAGAYVVKGEVTF